MLTNGGGAPAEGYPPPLSAALVVPEAAGRGFGAESEGGRLDEGAAASYT